MSIFPRLLYLLQVLPIKIPLQILKDFNRMFAHFIRAHHPPCIAYVTLSQTKTSEGIAIPDTILYYYACHLAREVAWYKQDKQKQWIRVEQAAVPFPLLSLPWCTMDIPTTVRTHPTIGTTWTICRRLFQLPQLSPDPSPLKLIITNPAFRRGQEDPTF